MAVLNASVSPSDVGVCADNDAAADLNLQVERSGPNGLIAAIGACTDGDVPYEISGLLVNTEAYEGGGTIAVHNCP